MGNCAVTQHAVYWADDGEWEPQPADEKSSSAEGREHKHITEVTIRITKRQLQQIVDSRARAHGLLVRESRRSAAQLLADIMDAGEVHHHHCKVPHWKPALQSIPEAVES